jgi:hypothetical protein
MADDEAFILSGYDDMGYDDEMGARRRAVAPRARPAPARAVAIRPAPAAARQAALRSFMADSNGLPVDQVMPFPTGQFTSAVTTLLLTAQPQREFQPRRLVIDFGRVGATSTGLVSVTQFTVGADPQFVTTGSIPASMFSPTAVGMSLKPSAARPGVTIALGLSLLGALTNPDVVNVVAAAVGPAVG